MLVPLGTNAPRSPAHPLARSLLRDESTYFDNDGFEVKLEDALRRRNGATRLASRIQRGHLRIERRGSRTQSPLVFPPTSLGKDMCASDLNCERPTPSLRPRTGIGEKAVTCGRKGMPVVAAKSSTRGVRARVDSSSKHHQTE